jgi:hypothetical protein
MKINLFFLIMIVILPFRVLAQPVEFPLPDNWKARRAVDITANGIFYKA